MQCCKIKTLNFPSINGFASLRRHLKLVCVYTQNTYYATLKARHITQVWKKQLLLI